MSAPFASELSRIAIAQLLGQSGFGRAPGSVCAVLADLLSRYLELLSTRAKAFSELQGRTAGNLDDVAQCLDELGVDGIELAQFYKAWYKDGQDEGGREGGQGGSKGIPRNGESFGGSPGKGLHGRRASGAGGGSVGTGGSGRSSIGESFARLAPPSFPLSIEQLRTNLADDQSLTDLHVALPSSLLNRLKNPNEHAGGSWGHQSAIPPHFPPFPNLENPSSHDPEAPRKKRTADHRDHSTPKRRKIDLYKRVVPPEESQLIKSGRVVTLQTPVLNGDAPTATGGQDEDRNISVAYERAMAGARRGSKSGHPLVSYSNALRSAHQVSDATQVSVQSVVGSAGEAGLVSAMLQSALPKLTGMLDADPPLTGKANAADLAKSGSANGTPLPPTNPNNAKRRPTLKSESSSSIPIPQPDRRTSTFVPPAPPQRRPSNLNLTVPSKPIVKIQLAPPKTSLPGKPGALPTPSTPNGSSTYAAPDINGYVNGNGASNGTSSEGVTNCICDNPTQEVDVGFMIECEECNVWYHGRCVGVEEGAAPEKWFCPRCLTGN
ncbi:hypothetical protein HK097_000303 [Rhizophlyctis rosea]|uniref:PHD-type domain-containing protein n=1 Tax=Rhizophlyctis rosea TaxID=64517 RepID=A0AAD5SHF8_9FUNG|nr:hypothetical protein HK097_000303 [Rhizophlyctis rosea]